MYVTVRNVGRGKSYETQANLRNLAGDGILLGEGRFDVSNMAPGDTRRLALTFDISPNLDESEVQVELSISDRDLREIASEKIKIPIEREAKLEALSGPVKAKEGGASLFESPSEGAHIFGKLPAGVALA